MLAPASAGILLGLIGPRILKNCIDPQGCFAASTGGISICNFPADRQYKASVSAQGAVSQVRRIGLMEAPPAGLQLALSNDRRLRYQIGAWFPASIRERTGAS